MANITMSTGGAVSGSITATIAAKSEIGAITTNEINGTVTIPAGALWIELTNAGAVKSGDLPNTGTVNGGDWSPGRKEKWAAEWNTNLNEYNYLPEITIDTNGARFFYTYLS